MHVLGIDVCSGFCSVAIIDGHQTLASLHEAMTRGHAERLAPMVAEVLAQVEFKPSDVDGIAVTTGPGSFTGARLGVSFARGLAFAANIPAVGVSVFEAMITDHENDVIVALPGKNGSVLVQHFSNKIPVTVPAEYPADTGWQIIPAPGDVTIIGSEAGTLLDSASFDIKARVQIVAAKELTAAIVANLGAEKLGQRDIVPPTPLYLRPPDAKPQAAVSLG